MATEQNRVWLGKKVHVMADPITNPRKPIGIALSEETARELAVALRKMGQTFLDLGPMVEELTAALRYVLDGDPESTATKKAMDVAKGMEPSGG